VRILTLALTLAIVASPALGMTTGGATILTIVRNSPQLVIDTTVPSAGIRDVKTRPYVRVAGVENFPGGFIDPEFASIGRTSGGMQIMAVPLESGGSGGVFTQLIFAQNDEFSKPYFAGYITSGGHLAVNVAYHGIVAVSPHYGPNDPNCCPSRYDTRTYTVVNGTLKLLSTRTAAQP
jgi:hypothetical protein